MKRAVLLSVLIVLVLASTGCQPPAVQIPPTPTMPLPTPVPLTPTSIPPTPTIILPTTVPPTPTSIPPTAKPGRATYGKIQVDSLTRLYLYYIPVNLPPNAPLLLLFHGYAMNAAEMRRHVGPDFETLAKQHGFIVVYLEGYETGWNDCRKLLPEATRVQNVDDMAFVHALIEKFKTDYGIDPSRVFATGYSNGGIFTLRLALELPEEIAAIAPIAAMLPVETENICHAMGKRIPVLIMNGTADPILPYEGGAPTNVEGVFSPDLSTQATAEYFVKLNGLSSPPQTTRLPHEDAADPTSVDRIVWSETGKPEVELVRINGGGHVIPVPKAFWPDWYGPKTYDINAAVEIWDFFSRQLSLK